MKYKEKEQKIFDATRLYSYGIWLLSKREYSAMEIFKKMRKYQPNDDIITSVIDKLKSQSYINDQRVIEAVTKAYSKRESSKKIQMRLANKGVDKDSIKEYLSDNLSKDEERQTCLNLLLKKFKTYNPEIKQKYFSFLANKGYSWDLISKSVDDFSTGSEDFFD